MRDNEESRFVYSLTLKWALEIAEGLSEMHAKSVMHGDLKPRNVITKTNVAKLIDFAGNGFSKPYYAPELHDVIARDLPWQTSVDIYSHGVLLREFICSNSFEYFTGDVAVESCLSNNPDDHPQFSTLITLIKEIMSQIC